MTSACIPLPPFQMEQKTSHIHKSMTFPASRLNLRTKFAPLISVAQKKHQEIVCSTTKREILQAAR